MMMEIQLPNHGEPYSPKSKSSFTMRTEQQFSPTQIVHRRGYPSSNTRAIVSLATSHQATAYMRRYSIYIHTTNLFRRQNNYVAQKFSAEPSLDLFASFIRPSVYIPCSRPGRPSHAQRNTVYDAAEKSQ